MKVKYEINTMLVKDMPLREIMRINAEILRHGGSEKAGIDQQLGIAAMYAYRIIEPFGLNTKGAEMTFGDFAMLRKRVGDEFIHIHRINYMLWWTVLRIYDWMEEKHLLTRNAIKYWRMIEKEFARYQSEHAALNERASYVAVQDHVRLAYDAVRPLIEPLEIALRDYMIQKRTQMVAAGQKDDILLLSKVAVGLLFAAACRNTDKNFLQTVIDEYGVNLKADFKYADISSIGRNFVWMVRQLGVKFGRDKDGDAQLLGIDFDKSVRVEAAWNAIVRIVTDSELMDEKALEAINMNPTVKADYEALVAREEEKELNVAIGDLSSRFKVSSL